MKKIFTLILCLLVFTLLSAFTVNKIREYSSPVLTLVPEPIELLEVKQPEIKRTLRVKDHYAFLDDIGFKESGNRYSVVNRYGYMGKYQFGMATLKGLGFNVTKEEFISNPFLQEEAMKALLIHNKKKLKRFIKKYEGKTVHGIYITESGILAAAHLGGQGNVRKFFRSGFKFEDGFGTSITSYMEKFSGYQLDLN